MSEPPRPPRNSPTGSGHPARRPRQTAINPATNPNNPPIRAKWASAAGAASSAVSALLFSRSATSTLGAVTPQSKPNGTPATSMIAAATTAAATSPEVAILGRGGRGGAAGVPKGVPDAGHVPAAGAAEPGALHTSPCGGGSVTRSVKQRSE